MKVVIVEVQSLSSGKILVQWYIAIQQTVAVAKVEEVRNNVAIYSRALLRIHVVGGQRSVRIAPPSLPPHHSGPATRNFQSSI